LSILEVTCDACGEQYLLAMNYAAQRARAEQERRERERAPSTEGEQRSALGHQ
jgi:hypothetical protein